MPSNSHFIQIDGSVAERISIHLNAEHWHRVLLDSALIHEIPDHEDPDTPQAWLHALPLLLRELLDAESAAGATRRVPLLTSISLPRWWGLWLLGICLLTELLAIAIGHTFEERMLVVSRVALLATVLGGGCVVWIFTNNVAEKRNNAIRRKTAEAHRDRVAHYLLEGTTRLLGQSFAVRTSTHAWLLHTPHLDWINARLRDCHAYGDRVPESLRSTLHHHRDTLQRALTGVQQAPPKEWCCLHADIDMGGVIDAWLAAGLPQPKEESERWARLRQPETLPA